MSEQKKNFFDRTKGSFGTRRSRAGSYSIFAGLLVVAIAVVVVLAVAALPSRYTQFDMTAVGLYSVGGQTEELVGGLTEDVTIYWLVNAGGEDSQLGALLSRYEGMSRHIKIEKVDPDIYPTFAERYTDKPLEYYNNLAVVCGTRSKYVDYTDIYPADYTYYFSTGNTNDISYSFNGESAVTSAIDYVTSESLPTLYILGGHGELALPATIQTAITNQNILTKELSLIVKPEMPEDADCVLIFSPESDITAEEAETLRAYLERGGSLMLLTDYSDTERPNLLGLMEHYGALLRDGIVLEGDENRYLRGYEYFVLPEIQLHEITRPLIDGGYYVLMPLTQGITVEENLRAGLAVTQILTTTDSAYAKPADEVMATNELAEGDIAGPFALGVAITEGDAQIVWLTTSALVDDQVNAMVAGANQDLFVNSINWMCEREDRISIAVKSLGSSTLTVPTGTASWLSALLIGIIPVALIAAGLVITIRRRRR